MVDDIVVDRHKAAVQSVESVDAEEVHDELVVEVVVDIDTVAQVSE